MWYYENDMPEKAQQAKELFLLEVSHCIAILIKDHIMNNKNSLMNTK